MDAAGDRRARAAATAQLAAAARRLARARAPTGSTPTATTSTSTRAAVALMDAWWPRFVTAEFQPALGTELFDTVRDRRPRLRRLRLGLGDARCRRTCAACSGSPRRAATRGSTAAARAAADERRRLQRKARAACRQVLLSTLARRLPARSPRSRARTDPAQWKVYATCDDPSTCDEIVPNTAGAVDTPPFPWQNRGTYHQIDEIADTADPLGRYSMRCRRRTSRSFGACTTLGIIATSNPRSPSPTPSSNTSTPRRRWSPGRDTATTGWHRSPGRSGSSSRMPSSRSSGSTTGARTILALVGVARRMPGSDHSLETQSLASWTIRDGKVIRTEILAVGPSDVREALEAAGLREL